MKELKILSFEEIETLKIKIERLILKELKISKKLDENEPTKLKEWKIEPFKLKMFANLNLG